MKNEYVHDLNKVLILIDVQSVQFYLSTIWAVKTYPRDDNLTRACAARPAPLLFGVGWTHPGLAANLPCLTPPGPIPIYIL